MRTKTGCKDSGRQEFNIKTAFFRPWNTESRCFSVQLTTTTSKKIMYRIRGKPLLITATFPLVLVHVLQQIYSHESDGLNARKQLLHNFYNSQFFRKILSLFNMVTRILSLKQRPYFLGLTTVQYRQSFCNE